MDSLVDPSPAAIEAARLRDQQRAKEAAEYAARQAEREERARRLDLVEELVSRRNPTQRDADKQLFMAGLEDDLERENFRVHGWRSALNASAIILAHNHPSGIAEPSAADRAITSRLQSALTLIDIRVLDHFIVGATTFSFAEAGLL